MIWTIPKVKYVEIKDAGPIKSFSSGFKEGITMICGPNASGKTTIVNCILACLCGKEVVGKGEVKLELASKNVEVQLLNKKLSPLPDERMSWGERHMLELEYALKNIGESQALLVDDFGERLDPDNLAKVLKKIKGKNVQAIITTQDKGMLKHAGNVVRIGERK
ncbi:MAG: AAA family ATPase [Candidatus Woesearchaeota archaeon]